MAIIKTNSSTEVQDSYEENYRAFLEGIKVTRWMRGDNIHEKNEVKK